MPLYLHLSNCADYIIYEVGASISLAPYIVRKLQKMKKTITYKEIKDKVLDIINNGGGGGGKSKLSELNDVTITSASDGQVLKYDGTKWVNGTVGGGAELKVYEYVGDGSNELNIPKSLGINCILGVCGTDTNVDSIALNSNIITDSTLMASILYSQGDSVQSTNFLVKYDTNNIIFYGGADAGSRLNYNGGHYKLYYI